MNLKKRILGGLVAIGLMFGVMPCFAQPANPPINNIVNYANPISNIILTPVYNVPNPIKGMLYYYLPDNLLLFYNGSAWDTLNIVGNLEGGMTYPDAGIALSTGTAWGTSVTNNSADWNTAYTDRYKWSGISTGLTASTGRTSLGGTTVGQAFFTLSNPSAVTFPRINVDNTVSTRSATQLKTDLSLENVTNESKSTMFSSPDFTGNANIAPRSTPVSTDEGDLYYDTEDDSLYLRINTSWIALNRNTGTGESMTYPGAGIAVSTGSAWSTSVTTSATMASNISDELGTGKMVFAEEEADLDTIAYILTDTLALYGAVLGVGNANDTTAFTVDNVIWSQYIDGSHDIVITEVRAVVYGTTPDIDIALLYDPNFRDGTPTTVLTADLTVTNTTTGNSTTSFSNDTITTGNWLWIRVDQADAKPKQLIVSIFGYRIEPE